ncbi:MAG: response regulator transcription factor [Herpetosiphon sp.]
MLLNVGEMSLLPWSNLAVKDKSRMMRNYHPGKEADAAVPRGAPIERLTVLIVDDEREITDLIEVYLKNESYNVVKAYRAADALRIIEETEVHLVILDIMMPEMDGVQACIRIRQERRMPIIMLSARTEDIDKIHGLTAGADDYLTKPFNPLELLARVKSQLRRYLQLNASTPQSVDELVVGDLIINTATHQVTVGDREVQLTPTEFAILTLMARNRGIVFSAERLYELVWQEPFWESANTVMVHIRKLREKLEAEPRQPRYIKTVWGVGYRLEG